MKKILSLELAKYFLDLSKITFTVLVVGQIAARNSFTYVGFVDGLSATVGFVLAAVYLYRKKRY